MLKQFYPGACLDSAYAVPYERLYEKGYRGILFDVDNTLVPHGAPADKKAVELFDRLRRIGFSFCILSNNKEPRVQPFAERVGSPYIYKAGKPKRSGYLRAMEVMGTKREQTLLVGDQLFTDVWGANRSGIFSILTKPIDPREEIQIILKRCPEAVVLFFYKRRGKFAKKQLKSGRL